MEIAAVKLKEEYPKAWETTFVGPMRADSVLVGCRRWNVKEKNWEMKWIWEEELELAKERSIKRVQGYDSFAPSKK